LRELDVDIGSFALEDGTLLSPVVQRVTIYGTPSSNGHNIVLVAHALTGSSRVADWWPGIVGDGALFDPKTRAIVCVNALGSCYGSTGARRVTVGDIVGAQQRALIQLGIERVPVVIGGSLGGMQALQWALDFPGTVEHAIVIGAHDHQSPMSIALNSVQRDCIALDPVRGLGIARKLAMLTYKSETLLRERHDRRLDRRNRQRFDVEGYLDHQAAIFTGRMDANAYVTLTHAADSFDVRDRQLSGPRATFVGISSDWRFRPDDIRLAALRLGADFIEFESDHGHDAFLAESEKLARLLSRKTMTLVI
jgi:homoserine O-acetyltransferase/O-succinyltransferase